MIFLYNFFSNILYTAMVAISQRGPFIYFALFCIESLKDSCCGFIDFSKPFDKIDRETLYRKLKQGNINSKSLNVIQNVLQ